MVYQLVYTSVASPNFKGKSDLDNILYNARRFNDLNQITGCLLFRSGVFLQLLEGKKSTVESLYNHTISTDRRHYDCKVVISQEVEKRVFETWSMNFVALSKVDLKAIERFLPWKQVVAATTRGGKVEADQFQKLFIYARYKAA